MVLTNRTCPSENTIGVEQSSFLDGRWDAHEIGWVIAGVTAAVATFITLITVWKHARNYYYPARQRQVVRIVLMPAVYAIVSFFSYRFFRDYTYYELCLIVYESLVLAAFLMLLLEYVGHSTDEQKQVLLQKEKSKIPFPLCFIRYRPSKPYFLHALKWSVLQYSLIRPLISIAGIITEATGSYCSTQYSVYYAAVYLDALDFVSISIALYGLILFYALCREQLAGSKPLAKFLNIKGIVFLTFYQGFIFSVLQSHNVIKATEYWTATNVADGLQALCTCCEMIIFAFTFMYAFSWKEFAVLRKPDQKPTNPFKALLHSFNYSDFFIEGWRGIVFFVRFILRRPGTRSSDHEHAGPLDIDDAFEGVRRSDPEKATSYPNGNGRTAAMGEKTAQAASSSVKSSNVSFIPTNAFGGPQGGKFANQRDHRMRQVTNESGIAPSSAGYSNIDSYYFRSWDSADPAVPMPMPPNAASGPRHDWQSETVVWSGAGHAGEAEEHEHERRMRGGGTRYDSIVVDPTSVSPSYAGSSVPGYVDEDAPSSRPPAAHAERPYYGSPRHDFERSSQQRGYDNGAHYHAH